MRHSFLSALAATGANPKELQTLARHSDPRLTLGVHTHARPEALGAAVGRLQLPGVGVANPLADLTRQQLEDVVVGLLAAFAALTGSGRPVDTPAAGTGGDGPGPAGTARGERRRRNEQTP